jgi:hypothetical protein
VRAFCPSALAPEIVEPFLRIRAESQRILHHERVVTLSSRVMQRNANFSVGTSDSDVGRQFID